MKYAVEFQVDEAGRITTTYTLDTGNRLTVYGVDLRRERGKVYAVVGVECNGQVLGFDDFNVSSDPERVRLANSTHKQLGTLDQSAWPATFMKRALDEFALGVWNFHVGNGLATVREYAYTDDLPALDYLLWPHVMAGAGTILFGPPGRGKTWMAMIMACAVHHGLFYPWRTRRANVLYVNLERDRASLERRQRATHDAMGLNASDTGPFFLHARGRSLSDVAEVVGETVKRQKVELVILDSLSRAGYGDLNDNLAGNRSMDALNAMGVAWLAIGHTPRSDESHLYGSQMFDAAADFVVGLMADDTNPRMLGIELRQTKNNHGRKAHPELFGLEFHDDGLSCVNIAQVNDFPELAARQQKNPQERVFDYLLSTGQATGTRIATDLKMNPSFVRQILTNGERSGHLVKHRDGPEVFYAMKAMN